MTIGNSNTIQITLEVTDKGTVKIKDFANQMEKTFGNVALYDQFGNAIKKVGDESNKALGDMTKGAKEQAFSLGTLKDSWMMLTAKVAAAGAAFYGAKRLIYDPAKQIASMANDIERQAGIIGVSIEQWQKLTYAAKMSDASVEGLSIGLKTLSQNISESKKEGSAANIMFNTLGVTGGTLTEVLNQIADRFAGTADGATKITYATALFGRGAMDLITLLNKGSSGIKGLGDEAVRMGPYLEM